jgi:hypothetical protein
VTTKREAALKLACENWFASQGYDEDGMFGADEMEFAFQAGAEAWRDLAAQPQPAPGLLGEMEERYVQAEQAIDSYREEVTRLTADNDRLRRLLADREPLTVRPADDVKPAPGLGAAMAETRALRARFAGLADALISEASSDDDAREHKADGISRLLLQQHADLRRHTAARINGALEGK